MKALITIAALTFVVTSGISWFWGLGFIFIYFFITITEAFFKQPKA